MVWPNGYATLTMFVNGAQMSIGGDAPSFSISGVLADGGPVALADFLLPRMSLANSGPLAPPYGPPPTINYTVSFDVLTYLQSLPPGGFADFVLASTGGTSAGVFFGGATLTTNVVPEPASLATMGLGLASTCLWARRCRPA
jgi:hypothetical protein